MNINIGNSPLQGFQTTDGGTKYRRVQTVELGTSTQTGLLELESKFSSDSKGVGRLLVRCEMPYYTVNTAACCCEGQGTTSPTYAPSGKITFHTVLTLPKAAIADLKSSNALLAANQIASIMGLTLGMSNTVKSQSESEGGVGDGLAYIQPDGKIYIPVTSDIYGILDPKRSIIRGIMGVTPIPAEGFDATLNMNTIV